MIVRSKVLTLIALFGVIVLASCGSAPTVSPTAATTPGTYSIKVRAAARLALRDERAEITYDYATLYRDRSANSCWTKRWPTEPGYARYQRSLVGSNPGLPYPAGTPIKVLWQKGDATHQLVAVRVMYAGNTANAEESQRETRRFLNGWAVLHWHSNDVGLPVSWNPCYEVQPT